MSRFVQLVFLIFLLVGLRRLSSFIDWVASYTCSQNYVFKKLIIFPARVDCLAKPTGVVRAERDNELYGVG